VSNTDLHRRDFLRLAAGGATLLATGMGCNSGSKTAKSNGDPATTTSAAQAPRTLRIAQWTHYVAGYDRWWDEEYTKRWGERNGFEVSVDHFDINQLPAHAEAEIASQQGHDLFHFNLATPVSFEDQVIDHRDVVEEIEAKFGKLPAFIQRSVFNPKTNKYFASPHFWTPAPVHYRTDLWGPIDARPDTWDDVLAGGRRLKAQGHPVGMGMGSDLESNTLLLGLIHAFGGSVQDEEAKVVINSRETVEAVKVGSEIFRSAMSDEVLGWDITSNNRYLLSGRGSLIVNSIAAIRALEAQDPALATKVELLPAPKGPAGTASPYIVSMYFIWKFSHNQDAAKQFLVDLASAAREPFLQSGFLQLPAFPGALSEVPALLASDAESQPPDKFRLLADAARWTTNVGHPGHLNVAVYEVVEASIISQMFAAASRGETTPEEAVKTAEAKIKPIYEKWREQGKI
jgi:multiple sugar transport system substrate-binding protein